MKSDLNFEINPLDFSIALPTQSKYNTRYIKPPIWKEIPEKRLKYSLAEDLAAELDVQKNSRAFVICNGSFVAGDLIEALIYKNDWRAKQIVVSTLSMSEGNVDSFAGLLNDERCDSLDLIVSDFFFSHERQNLVKYIYQELDKEDRFQLAVAGTHCKITLIETHCGKKVVIHGSANLRSSGNIEQLCIEENAELYDFNFEYQSKIVEHYQTVKKAIRHKELWQQVA
jgi:hypothetical protein